MNSNVINAINKKGKKTKNHEKNDNPLEHKNCKNIIAIILNIIFK